jgi:hypothetical protein
VTVPRTDTTNVASNAPLQAPTVTTAAAPADVVTTSPAADPPSSEPTPSTSALTVAVPPGYSRTPAWSAPIAAGTRSVATDDGTVLTRDPDGHVLLLDPATGRPLWSSVEETPDNLAGPWRATIDGKRAAVVAGAGRLTYWPLPAAGAAAAGADAETPTGGGVTVPLPAGAYTTWAGSAPLVHLPDRAVAVVRSGALYRVPLPAGLRALATDGESVLAADSSTWVRQVVGRGPAAGRPLPKPAGAGRTPLRVEPVGTALLLTGWPAARGKGQILALTDTRSGTIVVTTQLKPVANLGRAPLVREEGGTQLAVGSVVIDTYLSKVELLDVRYVVRALSRGHAWTTLNGRAVDLHLTAKGDFTTVPFGTGAAALPVGVTRLPKGGSRPVVVVGAGADRRIVGLAAG